MDTEASCVDTEARFVKRTTYNMSCHNESFIIVYNVTLKIQKGQDLGHISSFPQTNVHLDLIKKYFIARNG